MYPDAPMMPTLITQQGYRPMHNHATTALETGLSGPICRGLESFLAAKPKWWSGRGKYHDFTGDLAIQHVLQCLCPVGHRIRRVQQRIDCTGFGQGKQCFDLAIE